MRLAVLIAPASEGHLAGSRQSVSNAGRRAFTSVEIETAGRDHASVTTCAFAKDLAFPDARDTMFLMIWPYP